jgi:hypothetical protein
MSKLSAVSFNYEQCRQEVRELGDLLGQHPVLKEKRDILPFFKNRKQLSALCGILNVAIGQTDRIAHEFHLFNSFYCDLVVGDWQNKAYCFIEFEDAKPNSIFANTNSKKSARDWGGRVEHGYSQLIDWFHKIDGMKEHPDCETAFGKRSIDYEGVLVIGRDQYFEAGEQARLEWRTRHVIVHSKKIHCLTFDSLYEQLQTRLRTLELIGQSAMTANASAQPVPPRQESGK